MSYRMHARMHKIRKRKMKLVAKKRKLASMAVSVKTANEFSVDKNQLEVRLECTKFSRFASHKINEIVGNNSWQIHITAENAAKADSRLLKFQVACNKNLYSDGWECYAEIKVKLRKPEEKVIYKAKHEFSRYGIEQSLSEKGFKISNPGKVSGAEDTLDLQIRITVLESRGLHLNRLETFSKPKEHLTDVALVVEGRKCYVSKQLLASQSRVFTALFFSNIGDQGKEEIPLLDVDHAEFVDLLNMIYPSHFEINESNYSHILALADRFEFMAIITKVENFLIDSDSISSLNKLALADIYNLSALQESVVRSCSDIAEVQNLMALPEFERFKDSTKALFCQRIEALKRRL